MLLLAFRRIAASDLFFQKDLSVQFLKNDIGMRARNTHPSLMAVTVSRHDQIKGQIAGSLPDRDGRLCKVGMQRLLVRLRQLFQNLQLLFFLPGKNTCRCRSFDSLHSSRIRNNYTFYIFYNVAGSLYQQPFGRSSQKAAHAGCRISYRNGFRTAERGNQLFLQYVQIGFIPFVRFFHSFFSRFIYGAPFFPLRPEMPRGNLRLLTVPPAPFHHSRYTHGCHALQEAAP